MSKRPPKTQTLVCAYCKATARKGSPFFHKEGCPMAQGPRRKGTIYLNVISAGEQLVIAASSPSRAEADKWAKANPALNRVACVKLSLQEGQFDA